MVNSSSAKNECRLGENIFQSQKNTGALCLPKRDAKLTTSELKEFVSFQLAKVTLNNR